jgi:3-phenylpropionate/trans-cinnamate dioxygenase ferredoxin reductase subunit
VLPLPGADHDGVLQQRSLAEARALKERIGAAQSIAVVGGGFIGLEVASACASLGRRVTVIEMQERLMARALPPLLSEHFAGVHRRRGVDVRLRTGIAAINGRDGRVVSVALAEGGELPADLVLAGIGVVPNAELAQACGLDCADGIRVDRLARTSDPDIVAAGDCTRHPSSYAEAPLRLESVQNAMDQSRTAGATLAGKQAPYDAVPWFWSDQYDIKLQMAGLSARHDALAVRGSMEEGRFSICYLHGGRLTAMDSINRPADHMLARKLIAARAALAPEQAADPSFDLKSCLPQA